MLRRYVFFFSSRRRHTRCLSDWSSDVCSSDLSNLGLRDEMRSNYISGRTNSIAFHPSDPNTFYIGAAGGGVRSEERRVGKEWRSRWERYHYKKGAKIKDCVTGCG